MSRWVKYKGEYFPSRVNVKGGRKGCLCKDEDAYKIECCDGSLHAQGVGKIKGTS